MNKYKLVIFDLDGTILNTLEDLCDALNFALSEYGFPERTLSEVRDFVGNGILKTVERGMPETYTHEELDKVYSSFRKFYGEHCCDKTKPYPGIREVFRCLRENGVLIAVVSNKADDAVQKLCNNFFPGMIDYAAGEKEGLHKKPAPDGILKAMRSLHVTSLNTLCVGDSDVDIETSSNAGTDCVAVTWGFREKDFLISHGAKVLVDNTKELLDIEGLKLLDTG